MGEQAKRLMLKLGETSYANYQRNSNADPGTLAQSALGDIRGSNVFEYYGGNMAWDNKSGTKKAHQIVGVPELKFGDLVHAAIDERMRGISGGKLNGDSEYEMDRVPVDGGGFVLLVHPLDEAHRGIPILISSNELKERANEDARGELKGNQPKVRKYNGVNAFRRVKGESFWDRQKRINREVAAGADPVMHGIQQPTTDK
jgi:hypothetical protein